MESIDNLVVSFLDLEANKSAFRKELASILKILPSDIGDIWIETEFRGTLHQFLYVTVREDIPKDDLMNVDFDYISNLGQLIFDLGEIVL